MDRMVFAFVVLKDNRCDVVLQTYYKTLTFHNDSYLSFYIRKSF